MTHPHRGVAIERSLAFLHRNQLDYREFCTYASPDPQMAHDCQFDSSPFVTSLVVYSLSFVDHPLAHEMTDRGVDFLRSEMEGPGLWRYWSSRNPRHDELELDVDDTCCAAHVLRANGRAFPANEAALLANRSPEGLFYTYVAPRTGSAAQVVEALGQLANAATIIKLAAAGMLHEIGSVVHANALLYLGESNETQPVVAHLTGLVQRVEEAGASRYYPDPLAFYYTLSRAYFAGCAGLGAAREEVVGRVQERVEAGFGSALATALAACTLFNFGERGGGLDQAASELLASQLDDGTWERSAFYTDALSHYGSEELTTGLSVEALVRCGK